MDIEIISIFAQLCAHLSIRNSYVSIKRYLLKFCGRHEILCRCLYVCTSVRLFWSFHIIIIPARMEARQPTEGSTHDCAISIDSKADDPAPSEKNKKLFIYPFEFDEEKVRETCSSLTELGGDRLGVAETIVEVPDDPNEDGNEAQGDPALSNTSSRRHYITISQDDRDRLAPGVFFNDAIVDFFMSW